MPDRRLDASALYEWADAAVGALIAHTDEINRLNVFPVADSDTGTNMLFTMRAAVAEAGTAGAGDLVATTALERTSQQLLVVTPAIHVG